MLRNPRGATSLRWLRVLLDAGIEVHGQVVVCPGVNDGAVFEDTMLGILDQYAELATLGVVPLGLSRFSNEPDMRPHTTDEARAVLSTVADYQELCLSTLGRRLVFASDEYYLMAGEPFPVAGAYEGYPQHENGIGMVRAFGEAFDGDEHAAQGVRPGFFAWVDGAPPEGYRSRRANPTPPHRDDAPVTVLTGTFGAGVLGPMLADRADRVRVLAVENRYFGGTIGVAGLLTATDLASTLAEEPDDHRYLLPDACLSKGVFLDGGTLDDLPRRVEVVPTDGLSLRRALDGADAPAMPDRVAVPS
jgi:NifB/MoaA-like Fe-S oxidoreductase